MVAAIDSKRIELAKLQDRLHHCVDLALSDIREVATKCVLAKKSQAEPLLKAVLGKFGLIERRPSTRTNGSPCGD